MLEAKDTPLLTAIIWIQPPGSTPHHQASRAVSKTLIAIANRDDAVDPRDIAAGIPEWRETRRTCPSASIAAAIQARTGLAVDQTSQRYEPQNRPSGETLRRCERQLRRG